MFLEMQISVFQEIKNFTRNDSPNLLLVNIVVNVKGQPHVHRNCRSVIERLSLRTLYLSEPQHQWRIIACRRWTENAILQQKKTQNNNIGNNKNNHNKNNNNNNNNKTTTKITFDLSARVFALSEKSGRQTDEHTKTF